MVDLVAQSGLIESVSTDTAFAVLAADASSSDTVLSLESTDVLETETGTGQVMIGATVYDYEVDPDASTITLGSGLVAGASEGARVEAYPAAPVTTAKVSLDTGDSVTARVAAAHVLLLADGDRFGSDREFVTLYREGENYVTLDVPNAVATVKAGRIDDSAGDLDPEEDVVYLSGPPTHYLPDDSTLASSVGYADYATMEAAAGTAWAEAVSSLEFDSTGNLIIPNNESVTSDDGIAWQPVWMVPLNGLSCRAVVDAADASPSSVTGPFAGYPLITGWYDELWITAEFVGDDLSWDNAQYCDDFTMQWEFWENANPGESGAVYRFWSELTGGNPPEAPADAVPWTDASQFQVTPMLSPNQDEASVTGAPTYLAIRLYDPVIGWGGTGVPAEVDGTLSFRLFGVRVERS